VRPRAIASRLKRSRKETPGTDQCDSVFNVLGVEASRPVGPWRCSRRLTAGAANPGARCAGASFPTRALWHAMESYGLRVLHVLNACPVRLASLPAPDLPALRTLAPSPSRAIHNSDPCQGHPLWLVLVLPGAILVSRLTWITLEKQQLTNALICVNSAIGT